MGTPRADIMGMAMGSTVPTTTGWGAGLTITAAADAALGAAEMEVNPSGPSGSHTLCLSSAPHGDSVTG